MDAQPIDTENPIVRDPQAETEELTTEQVAKYSATGAGIAGGVLSLITFFVGKSYGENTMTRGKSLKRFFTGPNKYWPKRSKKRWF